MDPLPAEIVEKTWQKMVELPPARAEKLVAQMEKQQPFVMAYLMFVDEDIFNDDERELLFYLGTVVWQVMKQGTKRLPRVSEETLMAIEAANVKAVESLAEKTGADATGAMATLMQAYGQPEVLRYVLEALLEAKDDDERTIRGDSLGVMMLDLKTLIDAFNLS